MKLTTLEISNVVKGELKGNPDFLITGLNSVEKAKENELAYLEDINKTGLLNASGAGCILLPKAARGKVAGYKGAMIFVDKPKWAFAIIMRKLESELKPQTKKGVHPSAVIDPGAKISGSASIGPGAVVCKNAEIGNFSAIDAGCYVGENVIIGENSRLYPNVVIRENCIIGNRVIIHAGVIIGSDGFGYIEVNGKHEKVPHIGKVVIEDDVEIGSCSTVDRAMLGETRIEQGTKIDNLVQVAHNVKIGKNCLIIAQTGIAGSAVIGDNSVLAGQAGVGDHVKIGTKSIIGGQSGVISDVKDGSVLFGTPARPHREAMKLQALISRLPEIYDLFRKLKKKLRITL